MKRTAVTILSLTMAMPASALAKEPVAAKVCGKTQCHESKDKGAIAPLAEGGPPTDPPTRSSGWYSSKLTIGGEGGHFAFTVAIVPAQGLVRDPGGKGTAPTWMQMTPEAAREYRTLTAGLEPRPASTLAGVAKPAAVTPSAGGQPSGDDAPLWPWLLAGGLLVSAAAALAAKRWHTA
jgi:hypothetical protein